MSPYRAAISTIFASRLTSTARWAQLGCEVIAPSMFDRQQQGFVAAHDAAVRGLAAVCSYHGSGVAASATPALACPVICHFGRKDPYIPAEQSEAAIKAAHPEVPVYVYDNSGHGFNNEGPDSDPSDVRLARHRTLALFEKHSAVAVSC